MIRRKLDGNETLVGLDDYQIKELFLGTIAGVALVSRGPRDQHICYLQLTNTGNGWAEEVGPRSSYWLFPDTIKVLTEAQNWLAANADPDLVPATTGDWSEGEACGFVFRPEVE